MLFAAGASPFHRANPLTKLMLLPPVAAAALVWPPPVLFALAGAMIVAACVTTIGPVVVRRLLFVLGPATLGIFALHGLLIARGEPAAVGPLSVYPDGVDHAARVVARLALLVVCGLLIVVTTRPADLAKALDQAGLPPAFSFLLSAPLLLIDGIAEEARTRRDVLQVRGLGADGGIRARLRIVWFAVGSVAQVLLTDAGSRALALDARGFRSHSRRAVLEPPVDTRGQRKLRLGLLALTGLQILTLVP